VAETIQPLRSELKSQTILKKEAIQKQPKEKSLNKAFKGSTGNMLNTKGSTGTMQGSKSNLLKKDDKKDGSKMNLLKKDDKKDGSKMNLLKKDDKRDGSKMNIANAGPNWNIIKKAVSMKFSCENLKDLSSKSQNECENLSYSSRYKFGPTLNFETLDAEEYP
jgi:hypothetical protein